MDKVDRYFRSCCQPSHMFPTTVKNGVIRSMRLAHKYCVGLITDEDLMRDLILWTNIKEYRQTRQEPYALFFRLVFKAKKNGHKTTKEDLKNWDLILPRVVKIIEEINRDGSIFAKTIFNESIAHRYANYYILLGKYETEMKKHYLLAYNYALEGRLYKNIDSSIYWMARAYEYAGNKEEAYKYFCQVVNRKGKRYRDPGQRKKIKCCKIKCKEFERGKDN